MNPKTKVQFLPAQNLLTFLNFQSQTRFLDFFGIQKLFRIIFFFDKKYSKKIIGLFTFISLYNQATLSKKGFFFSITNSFLVSLLVILRVIGCIFDFFFVPSSLFDNLLLFGKKVLLLQSMVLVYLNRNKEFLNGFQKIKIISKPCRQVYVSYKLFKKIYGSPTLRQKLFVLTTVCGLLTHTEVLKKKIGGTLLFMV